MKEWDIYNVFIVAQNGSYSFDGISGFESQQASGFFHNNSRDLTEAGGAAIFKYDLTSMYIQDEIEISDKLNVLLGEFLASSRMPAIFAFIISGS